MLIYVWLNKYLFFCFCTQRRGSETATLSCWSTSSGRTWGSCNTARSLMMPCCTTWRQTPHHSWAWWGAWCLWWKRKPNNRVFFYLFILFIVYFSVRSINQQSTIYLFIYLLLLLLFLSISSNPLYSYINKCIF